jgi:hypothetical protein
MWVCRMCVCVYVCMCVCVYVGMWVCGYVGMGMWVCGYVGMSCVVCRMSYVEWGMGYTGMCVIS